MFENIIDGQDYCDLGEPDFLIEDDIKWELFEFSVGFDDLIDKDPVGNTIIKRYGKHWNLGCKVKVSDVVTVAPETVVTGARPTTDLPNVNETEIEPS